MKNKIKKLSLNLIKLSLGIITVSCMLLIYPVGIFEQEYISRTAADYSMNTAPIDAVAAIQEFVPSHDHLYTLGVDIGKQNGEVTDGELVMDFFDENLNAFAKVTYPLADMNDGTLTDIPVNLNLKAGSRYFVTLQSTGCTGKPPIVHYRSLSGNGPEENINFYYGPVIIPDASANIRYTYKIPLNMCHVVFYYAFILLMAALVYEAAGKLLKN